MKGRTKSGWTAAGASFFSIFYSNSNIEAYSRSALPPQRGQRLDVRPQISMIELFRDTEMARVGHYRSILESEGIRTFMRNEIVSGTEAAIPAFAPALCILDDADYQRAVDLIREYTESPVESDTPDITCKNCGETNPGNFGACWNCSSTLVASL